MALEIASFVIQVGERLWSSATGPVSNLVNYRKNIKNLNDEVEKLEIIRSDNRLSASAAQMNGEEIKGEVQMTCFGGCCPDWISRYKLSKQAKKDAHTVRELQGTGRFERVSLPGRRQLGIESTLSLGDFQAFESTKRAMDEVGANAHRDGLFQHVAMAVISQNPDLRKIQAQIADMLNLKLEEESEAGRAARLRERIMRGKSVLIILDDIWRRIDLSEIGIPSTGSDLDACKSKILLTTRLENVCHVMESQAKVPLNILSEQDSWTLFGRKAGRIVDSPDFHNVAQKIVKECGGLPIALVVVARALGDKDLDEWKEAGKTTRNDTDISIEDLVKYGLGQGLFQEANTIEEARGRARSVVKYLKACSLLLDSTEEGGVKMHDVVRDMAIYYSHHLKKIMAFMVQSGSALKSGRQRTAMKPTSHLTHSITDISILGKLEKLEILSLRESYIEDLPEELAQLANLRMLDFTMSNNIKSIPPKVISSLSRLEEMYMQGSFADWGLLLEGTSSGANAGFDELTCLHRLNILKVDISDAECMPKTVRFDPNWVNFDICINRKLFNRFMNVHLSRVTAARSRSLILDVTINTLPDWFNKVATERTENYTT
ncbi:Disease resistance protein [Vitis vinifera]|uniref:Disease resistance protein n=1 Tax=Vitis vinifera TaxID=29760 RepID=A0A438BZ27_VITVI|nr:Disease resistance protein [Vitis vinifera]